MQVATPINPAPLSTALRALLARLIPLVATVIAGLGQDIAAIARLKHNLTRVVFLAVELIRRLPELAAAAMRAAKPRKPAKDREAQLDRLDSIDRLPTRRRRSVQALVAQILHELGPVANCLGQAARMELAALAIAAQTAAAAWVPPKPAKPAPSPPTTNDAPIPNPEPHPPQPQPAHPPATQAQPRGSG